MHHYAEARENFVGIEDIRNITARNSRAGSDKNFSKRCHSGSLNANKMKLSRFQVLWKLHNHVCIVGESAKMDKSPFCGIMRADESRARTGMRIRAV